MSNPIIEDLYSKATTLEDVKKSDYFDYTYNGLDRIDNAKGYILDNVVPCCKHCNYAKRNMSTEKFYNLIKSIYENIKNRF